MTAFHRYATATALHDAIKGCAAAEAKLGNHDINQIRRHFAYDRFLTRLFLDPNRPGYSRVEPASSSVCPQRARHTQDIDLYRHGEIERAHIDLSAAANLDLGDFFSFDIEQAGALAGTASGRKYRVVAYIGDIRFADFQIDAVVDSNMTGVPDHAPGLRPIEIEGLPTTTYRVYPVADHLADKLVAMTSRFAGDRPSTRFRDLVDIVLIAQTQTIDAEALRQAVESERSYRNHQLPERLELPDETWVGGYAAIARTVARFEVQNANDALEIAVALYRPAFDDTMGTWEPTTMEWI